MGSPQRRQLQFDADAFFVRAFPFSQDSTDDDSGYPGSATDDSTTTSTSIGLGSATTETLNGNGDTLSLVVVSTQYGAEPVTSYSATSSSLPTTTTARTTSRSMAPTSTTTSNAASAGETTKSPTPLAVQHHHDNDLSDGSLAASIVVPVVVVLAIAAMLFFCFRRRKQQARGERAGSLGAAFIPASIKEKWSSMRNSNASGRPQKPVVTSTRNNTYNTGLDTSSHGSGNRSQQTSGEYTPGRRSEGGTTFVQPPPPYDVNARNSQQMPAPTLPQMAHSTPLNMSFDMPRNQQERSVSPHSRPNAARAPPSSHSLSPLSHIHDTPSAAALLAMPLDPPQPSSSSARSITSTLYSDTASVHSARAARVSIAGPNVVQSQPGASRSVSGSAKSGIDPFDTEANTPVTPLFLPWGTSERCL